MCTNKSYKSNLSLGFLERSMSDSIAGARGRDFIWRFHPSIAVTAASRRPRGFIPPPGPPPFVKTSLVMGFSGLIFMLTIIVSDKTSNYWIHMSSRSNVLLTFSFLNCPTQILMPIGMNVVCRYFNRLQTVTMPPKRFSQQRREK